MPSPISQTTSEVARRARDTFLPPATLIGFVVALFAIVLIAFFTYRSSLVREEGVRQMTQTLEQITELETVISSLKDAETGQRGYLLTGDDSYLEPYNAARAALPGELKVLQSRLGADLQEQARLATLSATVTEKLDELGETIELQRGGDVARAMAIVRSNRGKASMDRVRTLVDQMEGDVRALLNMRQDEWQSTVTLSTWITWGGSGLLVLLISGAALVMSRDYASRQVEGWVRTGQAGLAMRLQGEQRLDDLGEHALRYLASYLDAQIGAVYLAEGPDRFRRFAGHALPHDAGATEVRVGDGLLGQAAKERRPIHVHNVPADYLPIASGIGRSAPLELLLAPGTVDGVVYAVVELGFFRRVGIAERELLTRVSESLGVAVRASKDRTRLEELLSETQRQAEELQVQQEELRVSNEELEEQSRILKESQARLEAQQAELEQINAQLEEQAQILETQKEDLTDAQSALTEKAADLERANHYKSEFLANMSHELRTPLNSSLILAKLLADNKDGNLTPEQVRFARTIASAGNDLLALINDILDLSKIEAGKVELTVESIHLARTVEGLVQSFQPLAAEKQIAFRSTIEPGTPERIESDAQRLAQIMRNLLSNAFKFTEQGEVSIRVASAGPRAIAFDVRDTGIGIPPEQQGVIFEAFRQADGSTHRKYGGTGLGLSISRDLARLLGGDLTVHSVPGQGSLFTLTMPVAHVRSQSALEPAGIAAVGALPPRPALAARPTPPPAVAPRVRVTAPQTVDDRDRLVATSRRILVIEDDVSFAEVLRDLAHEMGFQCILTHTAGDGLEAAATYHPSAIVLDVNLPDHSGLGVLDQLKRNPQTRHIPVHVVSVADYAHQALERGAIGYALKPVQREQLVEAFRRLEAKATQSVRRVLVVEDDARQRESVGQLLGSSDVQIVGVGTAGDALAQLKKSTFDCVVLDLKLPDYSGYELLEQMAEQDDVSFPPVIVYTGRTLSRDEEQRLGRFSQSIIVKDARSPERLLDEVTLFLHQVESTLPVERQRMLKAARDRDAVLEGRRVLVVEDDARNIFALSSVLEPCGAKVEIARNGREALSALERARGDQAIDLVLMDIMMPEMDGLTAMREIRKRAEWKRLPIIALTAKAMQDDQEKCLAAGANDYIAKPLDVEKLLSLVRVWMAT